VAFASHSLNDTDSHYAQIKKEELAPCEIFADYVLGEPFLFETACSQATGSISRQQKAKFPSAKSPPFPFNTH